MDGTHRFTRRQALRVGAGVAALGAMRFPAAAGAATPDLFELALDDHGAHASSLWRTTPVLAAPHRFDLAGLRWAAGSRVEAQLRARAAGGRWTRWTPLPPAHGPLDGSEPVFTGAADELQLRLRGAASDLRVRFVRSLPHARAAARTAAAPTSPHARAAQDDGPPTIVPRSGWGGDSVLPRSAPAYGLVEAAIVHHTVSAVDYAAADAPAIIRGIARYHRDSNGWNDIGYNFLVDRYGTIYEGRAGGIEAAVIGAQAEGWNSVTTGIACLGTFTNLALDAPAVDALARLLGWKLSLHGVPVSGHVLLESGGGASNRYKRGTMVAFDRISGHRDGCTTTCPGNALYGQLPALRERAARYAHPVSAITVQIASQHGERPVPISGNLRFADESSPDGAALSIEYTVAGSAWTQLQTTNAAPDGAWATDVQLPASGRVRVVFAGDELRGRVESAPVSVTVVPKLTLTSDARRKTTGRAFRISGSVAPAPQRVTCVLERQVGSRWVTVQRKRIAVRDGRYATTVRPRKAGRHRVWIVAGDASRSRLLRAVR